MLKWINHAIDLFTKGYEWVMALILKGKHVKVNREKYICKLVEQYHADKSAEELKELLKKAIEGSPQDILSEKQVKKAYNKLRWHYGLIVFFVSFFMTTVPDIMWVVALAGVIDLYVFQCMVFRAMQKIMMLYGEPIDLNANITSGIDTILSIDRSGIMIGKHPILQKMKTGVGIAAKQLVQKQGPKVVTKISKPVFVIVRRQGLKWFSIIVAKEHVNLVFDLLIPITCAIISGLVSVVILVPMCNKLRKNIVSRNNQADVQGK